MEVAEAQSLFKGGGEEKNADTYQDRNPGYTACSLAD
jgi:hypothetical protein